MILSANAQPGYLLTLEKALCSNDIFKFQRGLWWVISQYQYAIVHI